MADVVRSTICTFDADKLQNEATKDKLRLASENWDAPICRDHRRCNSSNPSLPTALRAAASCTTSQAPSSSSTKRKCCRSICCCPSFKPSKNWRKTIIALSSCAPPPSQPCKPKTASIAALKTCAKSPQTDRTFRQTAPHHRATHRHTNRHRLVCQTWRTPANARYRQ